MIRALLLFVLLTIAVGGGIRLFQSMTNQDRWALTKTIGYATLCSAIAIVILSVIVTLF